MSIVGLHTAIQGLQVAQHQIDTISNNVANVNTEGYSRKILPQTALAYGAEGSGVLAGNVFRNTNINLAKNIWTQTSSISFQSTRENYLTQIENLHGPTHEERSITAQLSGLESSFIALANAPSEPLLQRSTLDQAADTVGHINTLAQHITALRNDAQNELETTVNQINTLLDQIAESNNEILQLSFSNSSTAAAEDIRDQSLNALSELISIDSFTQGDGTLIVQTDTGAELVGKTPTYLTFDSSPRILSAESSYPDTIPALFIGDPAADLYPVNLTDAPPSGKLGALLSLRDDTFPKHMAQLDELAYQMASRFDAQGLTLFTLQDGTLPEDTVPDPTATPPISVSYVGFARDLHLNPDITANPTLLQTGTAGGSGLNAGDTQVVNRILDYVFGATSHQAALGNLDLRVSTGTAPNTTLQNFLGLRAESSLTSSVNLNDYADIATFNTATGGQITATSSRFRIQIEEPTLGIGPVTLEIDLSAVANGPGGVADDIIAHINTAVIPGLSTAGGTALSGMNFQASVGPSGQLNFTADADITIEASAGPNPLGIPALGMLGLTEGTTEAEDPYFDIAVGTNTPTRITVEPADDENALLAKLNSVPGLAARFDPATGALELRPGNDFDDPDFGGSLTLVSGPFTTDTAGANTVIGAGSIPDGINAVSALFGRFSAGLPAQSQSPVDDVAYGSDISTTNTTSLGFREDFLGPDAAISTGIIAATGLIDFSQRMLNEHAQELATAKSEKADDVILRDLLSDQLSNETGVNIDEELAHLVVVQTSYSAAARVVSAVQALFDELFSVI